MSFMDWAGAPSEDNRGASPQVVPALRAPAPTGTGTQARTKALSKVEPERVCWLWQGYLPLGKIVVLDGDPGLGKSTLTMDLAARVSTGAPWPDGSPGCAPGDVLVVSVEDGLADTIRPRAEAAGGDLARIHAVTLSDDAGERLLDLGADLGHLRAAIKTHTARLLVLDPLMALLGPDVNAHRDQDVRRVLAPLAELANTESCTVLLVRHLNKASGTSALYRGGGSIGIVGAARAGLLVAPDPDDEAQRVLGVHKSNLAKKPPALAWRLEGHPDLDCARIVWLGPSSHQAEELLAHIDPDERSARSEATAWLGDLLAEGPVKATEVQSAAKQAGIAERTLRRASQDLGVRKSKAGMGGGWVWSLPSAPSEDGQEVRRCPTPESGHLRESLATFGEDANSVATPCGPEPGRSSQLPRHRQDGGPGVRGVPGPGPGDGSAGVALHLEADYRNLIFLKQPVLCRGCGKTCYSRTQDFVPLHPGCHFSER